jgi:hypothetical protein
MTEWNATITVDGKEYRYPAGPTLPNHFVDQVSPGIYLVRRGDAMLSYKLPADVVQVTHLGPHHFKLVEDGVVLADEDKSGHDWNCRFAVRASKPTAKKTRQDLIDRRLSPPYGKTGNNLNGVVYAARTGTWSISNITGYMGTTGERPDIGLFTDPSAAFLLSGKTEPMLQWAESAGAFAYHYRDAKGDGLFPNIIRYPGFDAYDQPGKQDYGVIPEVYGIKGPPGADGNFACGGSGTPQNAHWCDMSYVAAEVFEDPIMLMDVQDAADFNLGGSAELFTKDWRRVQGGEYRGVAHGLGMAFKALAATRDFEQRGALLPKFHQTVAYRAKLLEGSRDYYAASMLDPDCARFNVFPAGKTFFAPWQHDYKVMDLLFGVLTGCADWVPHCLFALTNLVARYSGKSGWPPALGGYYLNFADGFGVSFENWGQVFNNIAVNGNFVSLPLDAPTYAALKADPMNKGVQVGSTGGLQTSHASFMFASYLDRLGLLPAREKIPDFDLALANCNTLFKNQGWVDPRYSVIEFDDHARVIDVSVREASAAPPPSEPGTPPPPPPNYGADKPGPDGDPKSYAFESPTLDRDAVTTKDELYFNVSGKAPGGFHQIIANIKGGGSTKVWLQADFPADWFVKRSNTPGGADLFIEEHGTGNVINLYDCSALVLNGVQIWQRPETEPAPSPEPAPAPAPDNPGDANQPPTQEPTMSLLDPIKDAVHATEGVIDSTITLIGSLAQKLHDLIANGTDGQINATEVQALADELNAKKEALAAAVAANQPPAG